MFLLKFSPKSCWQKIVNSDTSFVADIILQDGKIAKVGPNLDIPGKYSSVAQEKCVTPILRHKLLINATESSTLTFKGVSTWST